MNRLTGPLRLARTILALLGLTLLVPGIAQAQTTYKMQPIIRLGDTVAGVPLKAGGHFQIGSLNDRGQLIFAPSNGNEKDSEALILYSGGQFIPIVVAGQPGPRGNWTKDVAISAPVSMNQRGHLVFNPVRLSAGLQSVGVFRWDAQTQQTSAIALRGMPAVNNLTFTDPGSGAPAINNQDEIAFIAGVKNAAGMVAYGIFFLGQDGQLQPVALPDEALPDGGTIGSAGFTYPSLNDTGLVGFQLQRQGDKANSGYLWEKGVITPVARVGQDAPGGGTFAFVSAVRVNNQNRTALVAARLGTKRAYGAARGARNHPSGYMMPGQRS